MKTYLWIMHLAFGLLGLLLSLDPEGASLGLILILFSVVALLCLVYLYISEKKSTSGK